MKLKTTAKCTLTHDQLHNFVLSHSRGGNGWVMFENIDREYCRVGPVTSHPEQVFLAWKPLLTVELTKDPQTGQLTECQIPDELLLKVKEIRDKIKSGKLAVVSSHIEEVEKLA